MAIAIDDNATYESGSGGYAASHTLPDIDCSGTDSYAIACGFNRNPTSDVSSWTFEGATPDDVVDNINTNVSAVSIKGDIVNDADLTIISNTPSYKLQAMIGIALSGVDQTTPIVDTLTPSAGYGASATASYTGTSGNLLLVFIGLKDDRTFTASGCTEVGTVTHLDANVGSGFVGYVEATGSSQTIGASWTGDTNTIMAIVEIAAAVGGDPPAVRKIQTIVT